MRKIIAAGPVVIKGGRLLVAHDGKDNFYKIPGGKPLEGETLEDCVYRELFEETGYKCRIVKKLSTKYLKKKPGTDEEIRVELYHFKAELLSEVKSYESFYHNGHHVNWLSIERIKKGEYEVAPNIEFLMERKEIL